MPRVRLLILAIFALLALTGIVSAAASAETPAILALVGKITELKGEGTGTTSVLEGKTSKKTVAGKSVTAILSECKELEAKPLDTANCNGLLTFKETKQGAVACRSETEAGTKDPVETILVKGEVKLAAEKSTEKVLVIIIIFRVFGINGTIVIINCGGVKEQVRGEEACLSLPGLTITLIIEILCKQKEGGPITGTCEQLPAACEELAKNPLEASLNGTTFEPAAEELHIKMSFNKDIFPDD